MPIPEPVIKPAVWRSAMTVFFLFIAVMIAFIFPLISDLVVVMIISLVLTYIFRPGMVYLEQLGIPREWSIIGIFALVIVIVSIALRFFIPVLVDELGTLAVFLERVNIGQLEERLIGWINTRSPRLGALVGTGATGAEEIVNQVSKAASGFLHQSLSFFAGAANALALSIVVPIITFFLMRDGDKFIKRIIEKIPNRFFEMSVSLTHRIDQQLGNYIRSVLLESLIIGIICWISFEIVGVKFALVLGLLNGFLNMIPFFGPLIAYIPTGLVFLVTYDNVFMGLFWMVTILVGAQMLDNVLLKPILISRSVNVHPAAVLITVLIGGRIAGPIGMFIAVPVYAILKVIILDLYTHLKDYRIIQ